VLPGKSVEASLSAIVSVDHLASFPGRRALEPGHPAGRGVAGSANT
jgi:hypothetical protein